MKKFLTFLFLLIALVSQAQDSDLSEELAFKKCEMIREMIVNGSDFAEMAARFSQDPGSSQNGGEIGYMMPGSLVEEYWNAAYDLEVGEISAPVRSQYGYHIIQVLGKKGGAINTRHILVIPE